LNKAERVLKVLKRHYGMEAFQPKKEEPFRALVGCILSQRTRDENAVKAAEALFDQASSPEAILQLDEATLKRLIRPSGYYNQKAKYIIGACKAIIEGHKGKTPHIREELLNLPGVGPKTADIVLSYGYSYPAIAVDTHIHRVSRRVGLAHGEASPIEVKKRLETSLPSNDWWYTDGALLQLGKDYCKPRRPRCNECPVGFMCDYNEKIRKI